MGNDKRDWRKLVKKLRRSKIRQRNAIANVSSISNLDNFENLANYEEEKKIIELEKLRHEEEEAAWLKREEISATEFKAKIARKERDEAELQEKLKIEAERKAEEERIAKELLIQQEENFNKLVEFLVGDIEDPPVNYLMPQQSSEPISEACVYFVRTGACRFAERCNKPHPAPILSSTLLISNFFTHFSLEQGLQEEGFINDMSLEYEESDIYKEFISFHKDVLPEVKKFGQVIQFKVCQNYEPHLRGNVYIQYKNIRHSVEAYRALNGRFFDGKQLSVKFIKIDSWLSAICGQFTRGRCLKGRTCNYLHVFRNLTNEFRDADNDWISLQKNNEKNRSSSILNNCNRERKGSSISNCSSKNYSKSKSRSRSRSSTRGSSRNYEKNSKISYKNIEKNWKSRSQSSERKNSSISNCSYKNYQNSKSRSRSSSRGSSKNYDKNSNKSSKSCSSRNYDDEKIRRKSNDYKSSPLNEKDKDEKLTISFKKSFKKVKKDKKSFRKHSKKEKKKHKDKD